MIHFFENASQKLYAVEAKQDFSSEDIAKLEWLFGQAKKTPSTVVDKKFIGPRAAMATPWSTNAVEITQNMGIEGITRIEEFEPYSVENHEVDPMINQVYPLLNQDIFTVNINPDTKFSMVHLSLTVRRCRILYSSLSKKHPKKTLMISFLLTPIT